MKNETAPRIAIHIKASKWSGARVAALIEAHFGSVKSVKWLAAFDPAGEESRPTIAIRCGRSWAAVTAAKAFWAALSEAQKPEQLYVTAVVLCDASPMHADSVAE